MEPRTRRPRLALAALAALALTGCAAIDIADRAASVARSFMPDVTGPLLLDSEITVHPLLDGVMVTDELGCLATVVLPSRPAGLWATAEGDAIIKTLDNDEHVLSLAGIPMSTKESCRLNGVGLSVRSDPSGVMTVTDSDGCLVTATLSSSPVSLATTSGAVIVKTLDGADHVISLAGRNAHHCPYEDFSDPSTWGVYSGRR